jgi:hypothetical protein
VVYVKGTKSAVLQGYESVEDKELREADLPHLIKGGYRAKHTIVAGESMYVILSPPVESAPPVDNMRPLAT